MLLALALSAILDVKIDVSTTRNGKLVSATSSDIVAKDGSFALDGRPIEPKLVEALADAVAAPVFAAPTAQSLGFDSQTLRSEAQEKLTFCSGVALTPVASEAFVKAFTDVPRLDEAIAKYYGESAPARAFVTTVRVAVSKVDGTMVAESASPKGEMLPWNVSNGTAAVETYNGGIARALTALLPPGGTDHTQLRNELFYRMLPLWEDVWMSQVCSKDLRDLAFRSYLPKTIAFAKDNGLVLDGFIGGGGTAIGVNLTLQLPAPPVLISFNPDPSGGDAAVLLGVEGAAQTLRRVAAIPWLHSWLLGRNDAKVNVQDPLLARSPFNVVYVDELREAGFTTVADRLRNELSVPGILWIDIAQINGQCFLLRNDDVVLVDYQPANSTLPFSPEINARIRARSKKSPNSPNVLIAGLIVHPDGSIDW